MKPGVEVDSPLETIEAMIAQNDDQGPLIGELHGLADHFIAAPVVFFNDAFHPWQSAVLVSGMAILSKSPEHVLQAVRCIEQAVEESILMPVQLRQHHP